MSRDAWFVATLSRSLNRRMTAAVTRALTRVASVAAVGVLAGALALLATPARASAGTTERVSVDSAGNAANASSGAPAISADGRFVAFDGGTAPASIPRSAPTAASSPSSRTPPTSCPGTRTASPTCSSMTGRPAPPSA